MASDTQLRFEASAYLQTLIGRELIRSEELALIELVKNAYDSGASNVIVILRPPSIKEPGEIEIRDNGSGMTLAQFKRSFMWAGYSDKPKQQDADRVPTGEKGIGRFAADRLGQRLTVITKAKTSRNALRVEIDWAVFNTRTKRFSDVTVPVAEIPGNDPSVPSPSGTVLRINKVREKWDREQVQSLRRALAQLLDPYHRPSDFTIEVQVLGSTALSGPILQPPISGADIEIDFRVLKNGAVSRQRKGRLYGGEEEKEELRPAVDLSGLAGLRGRFFYFLRRPSKDEAKSLLPGVRIYRDGFRVEPLGSHSADWLGVAEKRAKRAGHAHIVPSRLFGFVAISRVTNPELKDTTSREALIDTAQARGLVSLLRQQLDFLESSIQTDVAEPRWKESRERKAVALDQARLQSLSIMSFGLGHELRQPLQSIRFEAENIAKRLLQLNIVDNDISEAQHNIDADIERIDKNIQLIASISSGSLEKHEEIDLAKVVRDQAGLFDPRCAAQGIELSINMPDEAKAEANATLVGIVLINLIKNAIDALAEVEDGRRRKIVVSLRTQGRNIPSMLLTTRMEFPKPFSRKSSKNLPHRRQEGGGLVCITVDCS